VIPLEKVKKQDIIDLLALLKSRGWTQDELAIEIGRNHQTIYRWGAKTGKSATSVPSIGDYKMLQQLTEESED
jgi:hypothetical protein